MVDFARLAEKMREPRVTPIVPIVAIGITGHRPHKLPDEQTGYDPDNPLRVKIRESIRVETEGIIRRAEDRAKVEGPRYRYTDADYLESRLRRVKWRCKPADFSKPLAFSGMALGADQDAAGTWARMGIPFVAVVPFSGQELRWPKPSQKLYHTILNEFAAGVIYVSEERPADDAAARSMLKARNEWLCCTVDELIAVYDGSKGGTSDCWWQWNHIQHRPPVRIDPRELV